MARISTHVLDTARGRPAAGIQVRLYRIDGAGREQCGSAVTNADGRTGQPLLSGDRIAAGIYELVFDAGAYLHETGQVLAELPFLDQIVIRFGVSDETSDYHVPLLLAPYGYSTYRGS